MIEQLRRLLDHLAWADGRAVESLRDASAPDPRALELLAHVVAAEELWLARLESRPARVAVWPALSLDECEALARETHAAYARLLDTLDGAGLRRSVHYRNSIGREFDSTVEDILLHVMMHGAYHRGQVALTVRSAGGQPAMTDYIAFVRGEATAPRVPAR